MPQNAPQRCRLCLEMLRYNGVKNKGGPMIFNRVSSLTKLKEGAARKLATGTASLLILTAIGVPGIAGATPSHHQQAKPTKAQCAAAGFKNYGQCVKEWAHGKNHGGGGYGGGNNNNVSTNITVNANHSSHNVINIVINYIFG